VWFRIFTSALVASVSWSLGALVVWLLGELKLSPELQAHHPFAPPTSDLFKQTSRLFLGALGVCGAMGGFLLPEERYGTRKLVELEATAHAMALLWGLLAGTILVAAVLESVAIWPFVLLCSVAAGLSLLAARAVRVAKRRSALEPWASGMVPLITEAPAASAEPAACDRPGASGSPVADAR